MGLSSFPEQPSKAGYEEAFKLAGENGELILIQRAPPWEEFRPGGVISAETLDLTREEKRLAEENGLGIFAAVDPLDPADRGRLASPPEDLADAGFGDPRVRSAFIAYAQYLALNLRPRYMALGMEVDLYEAARPDDFDNFVSLYFEAYDAVKDISPETLVFPTFQMEAIQNLLSPAGQSAAAGGRQPLAPGAATSSPRWTSWPLPPIPASPSPPPTTSRLTTMTSSGATATPPSPSPPRATPRARGARASTRARRRTRRPSSAVCSRTPSAWTWPSWSGSPAPIPAVVQEPPLDLLQYIGLRRADGSAKPAWQVWTEEADVPLSPGRQP